MVLPVATSLRQFVENQMQHAARKTYRFIAVLLMVGVLPISGMTQTERKIGPIWPHNPGANTGGPPPPVQCANPVVAAGSAKNNQALAEIRSRQNWEDKVSNDCGQLYVPKWGQAVGQTDVTCGHNGGKPINRTWTCNATAKPKHI
jgi:hypothetical protein